MKTNPSRKRLALAKETLIGLEVRVHGGTYIYPSTPACYYSGPLACGGGGGDTSAGFYENPESCNTTR